MNRHPHFASRPLLSMLISLMLIIIAPGLLGATPRPAGKSLPAADRPQPIPSPPPQAPVTIPWGQNAVTLDGFCGSGEYDDAISLPFNDAYGITGTVYLKHNDTDLYVCMRGAAGSFPQRFARVYLDTDDAGEPFAEGDDLALQVNIVDGATGSYKGTGVANGYVATALMGWAAAATQGNNDTAEYRISIALTNGWCSASFGLAVYHHWVSGVGDDYGWPSNQYYDQPQTWAEVGMQSPPCQMPVFRLSPPTVNPTTTLLLAGLLEGIGGQQAMTNTSHAGTPRFTVANQGSGAALEQYAASGGFFAFNATEAFSETNRGPFDPINARLLACQFLMLNELFPWSQTPLEARNCYSPTLLPYEVNIINLTGQSIGTQAIVSPSQAAIIVHVPLGMNVGTAAPQYIPLRGPGGHLSLLFTTTDLQGDAWSLDDAVPGLAALAEPWHGRQTEVLGSFPLISRDQAIQQLQGRMPGVPLNPGALELAYYVEDPAVPQPLLIPVWNFPGATAVVDGITTTLRTPVVPAVPSLLPSVAITAPPDGTTFMPGQTIALTGSISGGTGPYTYTWSLEDGTALGQGTSSGGTVQLTTNALPAISREGIPISLIVQLSATDSNGASAADGVTLQPGVAPMVFLPLVVRSWTGPARAVQGAAPATVNYRVGAEWVQYYNGTNADLPGTVPDGTGFYDGLRDYGWDHGFEWSNNFAWEKDWRDSSLGGIDNHVLERASFAYFAGHGSPVRTYFGVTEDTLDFYGGNGRFDQVQWVGFASCSTMYAPTIDQWFTALGVGNGARMLLGFHSGMADVAFGPRLVDNMRIPSYWFFGWYEMPWLQRTIAQAWEQTAFEMNAGLPAYLYVTGNGVDPSYDKLPKGNDALFPKPYPGEWYVWVWWE